MAEGGQVLDHHGHGAGVVAPHRREAAVVAGTADDHRRQPQLLQDQHPLVLDAQVDEEDAVDPPLGEPAPVGLDLGVVVGHDLEQQGDGAGGQGVLDA
jgi:hypothetical protein